MCDITGLMLCLPVMHTIVSNASHPNLQVLGCRHVYISKMICMYDDMCVCMSYICMYLIHLYVCMYACLFVCMYVYMCGCMCVCSCVCMYVRVFVCVCMYIHTHIYVCRYNAVSSCAHYYYQQRHAS